MNNAQNLAIEIKELSYSWKHQDSLQIPGFEVKKGEKLFVQGESGSGKTTLLNLIAGVLQPKKGKLRVLDKDFSKLSSSNRDHFRSQNMGIIFQQFNLIPFLTVEENLKLRLKFQGNKDFNEEDLLNSLEKLSLSKTLYEKKVSNLSVGQQQRVAALRAFLGNPQIILADEPSSSLDYKNTAAFMEMLLEKSQEKTVLFVSHDERLAKYFSRTVSVHDFILWQGRAQS